MKTSKLGKMTRLAILTAIILIMSFTPLGYLRIGLLSMTLIMIPVAVGAITMGPAVGAFLGAVFGLSSFVQCFGLDAFGTMLLSLNPVFTFFVTMAPRIAMGFCCGWIFRAFAKKESLRPVGYVVASFSAAALNTLLFMSTLVLLFLPYEGVFAFPDNSFKTIVASVAAMIGVQGLLEALLTTVVGAAVSAAIFGYYKHRQK